jgi:hypothetical protein
MKIEFDFCCSLCCIKFDSLMSYLPLCSCEKPVWKYKAFKCKKKKKSPSTYPPVDSVDRKRSWGKEQEHRGRYDIKESNLMQHKEQQKSNSIFIKKHFLSVRQTVEFWNQSPIYSGFQLDFIILKSNDLTHINSSGLLSWKALIQ